MTDVAVLRARPTTYNGIQMRSRLEARVAAWLDSLGVRWLYEPNAFASPAGQYLPDFRLLSSWDSHPIGRRVYLEVKGAIGYEEATALMDKMATTIGASDPRAFLVIADEEMLEEGTAHTYNYQRLGAWWSVRLLPFLVDAGVVPMPSGWAMPAWDE